jgi:Reverse transcriptase (RNA-dependent DNA polymerase)
MAAKWRFGRCQHLIPALMTAAGLSDQPALMAGALSQRFFNPQPTRVPETFPDNPPHAETRPHAPVTITEIADALGPTSNNSTPGPSGHNYKLVKWAFAASPERFQALFEACLQAGHHPRSWKLATIAVVPKPSKEDYSLPKCYRPVALLECLGKLLEKVVAKRLTYDITALGLIPTTQLGARPFSSTIDAGLCLTHDIETAHALGGVCGTLLFDIQGFFDNVNHSRLSALVHSLGFSPQICNWTSSFLRDRTVRLRFNNYSLEDIELEMGTPQGSPISPILSIIYASPLLHLARSWANATFLMYIDDGNIFARAPTYHILAQRLRDCYTACHTWCQMAGLTIEPEKTEILFFSRCRANPTTHGDRPTSLLLPDRAPNTLYSVAASDHVRYLGLHFDHKLSWDKHISVVASRTKSSLKALQLLGNSVRGLNHGSWRLAFNAICIPALTYGAPIWFRGQQKHIKTLQTVQNAAVGIITGAFRSTPREPLHQLIVIPPIQIRLQRLATQAAIRLLTLPKSSPVLHRLGPPWCSAEGSGVPLPYPMLARPLDTCIHRLSSRVPAECRLPPCLDHPPWKRCTPPADRFTITHNPCKGCWNIIVEWERWVDAEGERDDAQSVRGLEEGTSDVNGAPRATGSG